MPSKEAQTVLGLVVGLIVLVGLAPLATAAPASSDHGSAPIALLEVQPVVVFETQIATPAATPAATVTPPDATSGRVVDAAPIQQLPDPTAKPSPRQQPTKAPKTAKNPQPAPAAQTPTSTPAPTPEPKAAPTADPTPKPKPEPKPKKDPKSPKKPKPGG